MQLCNTVCRKGLLLLSPVPGPAGIVVPEKRMEPIPQHASNHVQPGPRFQSREQRTLLKLQSGKLSVKLRRDLVHVHMSLPMCPITAAQFKTPNTAPIISQVGI